MVHHIKILEFYIAIKIKLVGVPYISLGYFQLVYIFIFTHNTLGCIITNIRIHIALKLNMGAY